MTGLAGRWTQERGDHPRRIAISRWFVPDALPARGFEIAALFDAQQFLSNRDVVGDGAVHITREVHEQPPPWQWPLDVATDPSDDRLYGELADSHFARIDLPLVRVRRLGRPNWRCSVLILNGSLTEAAARILSMHSSIRATVVIILGRTAATPERADASIELIARIARAQAIAVGAACRDHQQFLVGLVAHLSHDEPLDIAIARAANENDGSKPLIIADPELLRATRLSLHLEEAVREFAHSEPVFPPAIPGLHHLDGLEMRTANGGLGAKIAARTPTNAWRHEHASATGTAVIESMIAGRRATNPEPRFLLAQLTDTDEAVKTVMRDRPYKLEVKVGPREAGYRSLDRRIAGLPRSQRDEQLMVVFTEPMLAPNPQVEWITLPPNGPSSSAWFEFATTATTERIEARIAILHDGRMLQSAVVSAVCDGKTTWTLERDATARVNLAGLEDRRHFGATLIANHTTDGIARFLAADAKGNAARLAIDPNNIKEQFAAFAAAFEIVKDDPKPDRTLKDKSSVDALRKLARKGAMLHEALVDDNGVGPALLRNDPIQIVAARADAFFPLELAYRFPAPSETAKLCKYAEESLVAGACNKKCGAGDKERLCPLGFWSLSRVIERCEYQVPDRQIGADFGISVEPLRGRNELVRPVRVALGAADKANARVKTAVKDLATALAETFGGKAPAAAATWKAWETDIGKKPWPALLVLVPHHDREDGEAFLEIGKKQRLKSADLEANYVLGARKPDASRPIVLLAGCETAMAEISYESFVSRFRRRGAAVVVGTIASVLGLDAAPVAGELASDLMASFGKTPAKTIGEALLDARRRLVAMGRVMVLSLAAYGDADWELT